jgi:hypothetical protein
MLINILAVPVLILFSIIALRMVVVFGTDRPVTNLEEAMRVFLSSFRKNLAETPKERFTFDLEVLEVPSRHLDLTEEDADLIAEQVIRAAWAEAKRAPRHGDDTAQAVL